MQFQIRNKQGVALTMGELDKIAADFWGVELRENKHPCPKDSTVNWYAIIGWKIADLQKGQHCWSDVVASICQMIGNNSLSYKEVVDGLVLYTPYIKLCFYFQELDLIPYSI